jgi:LacI family transcriptional regulator
MNLEDIAKKAGVSRSTVSRVINNDPKVSQETRRRVLEVIEQEHFSPNPAARALVTRRSEIIGVVIPTVENIFFTDNSYFPMLLAGLGSATRRSDYAMLLWLGEVSFDDEKLIRKVSGNRLVDGLVIASLPSDHPLFRHLSAIKTPFVMVEKPIHGAELTNYVTIDNVESARAATQHLISLGRRKIAHITGHLNISDAQDRLIGYKQALTEAGLPIDPNLIYEGFFSIRAGYAGMKRLLQFAPDALFAAGDTIAIGALQAMHEVGARCPEDVAIVGFDDIDVATQSIPRLTTMRQPVQYKGEMAARVLIDLLEGRVQAPQHILLPTELIIRESCGATARSPVTPYHGEGYGTVAGNSPG